MTISIEDIKARIDAVQGTPHDPEDYGWKNALAFADLLGFKLKSWRDEEGTIHYGEPPEDARDVDRLIFENGEVWRSNPPEGDETHWKATDGYAVPFYGELWKDKCQLARLNSIAGDDPRAEPYRLELESFIQDFSDAILSNAPALHPKTVLRKAHLDSLPGARSADIVYAYKTNDELNPRASFRMSKRFADNQYHQDVTDGKIDPLTDLKREDAIFEYTVTAIVFAALGALWYFGILAMVPDAVWLLLIIAYLGFVAVRFVWRVLTKYQIVIRERPTN